jgi:hypothetical protein
MTYVIFEILDLSHPVDTASPRPTFTPLLVPFSFLSSAFLSIVFDAFDR